MKFLQIVALPTTVLPRACLMEQLCPRFHGPQCPLVAWPKRLRQDTRPGVLVLVGGIRVATSPGGRGPDSSPKRDRRWVLPRIMPLRQLRQDRAFMLMCSLMRERTNVTQYRGLHVNVLALPIRSLLAELNFASMLTTSSLDKKEPLGKD